MNPTYEESVYPRRKSAREVANEAALARTVEEYFGCKLNTHILRAVAHALSAVNKEALLRQTDTRSLRRERAKPQGMPTKKELEEFNQRKIYVILECTEQRDNELNHKFIDIEEDMQGADVVTFECAKCGKEHKSRRYGR